MAPATVGRQAPDGATYDAPVGAPALGRGRRGAAEPTGWALPVLVAAVVVSATFRVVALEALTGELYGDIAIVHEYLAEIRDGRWPTAFHLSAGPLYHYLIAPVVLVGGEGYTTLKVASVLVSAGVLAATYLLARELVDRQTAAVTLFVAGASSWLLVFSRLGNSQIVTPLITTGALWFAVRTARRDDRWSAVDCGAAAALGLYAYPQTFVVPPALLVVLVLLRKTGSGVRWGDVGRFAGTEALLAVPFLLIAAADRRTFLDGYIGGKIHSRSSTVDTLVHNAWRAAQAFHVRGDEVFRSNPVGSPHLDRVSGILFLAGLVWWLAPSRRRWWPVVLLPLVLFQLPAIFVLRNEDEVPSASRTLLVAPLVYVITASGLCWLVTVVARRREVVGRAVLVALLCAVTMLNSERYFGAYADGLPDRNVPFGRVIADFFERLPEDTHAFTLGCCWGQAGQPEPKGITYLDAGPVATGMVELQLDQVDCVALDALPRPAVLVWAPEDVLPSPALAPCAAELRSELHTVDGQPVFRSLLLPEP
ncbi:hypothetical protein BH10ACT1_BH10ACT1_15010 [soil metagenome]